MDAYLLQRAIRHMNHLVGNPMIRNLSTSYQHRFLSIIKLNYKQKLCTSPVQQNGISYSSFEQNSLDQLTRNNPAIKRNLLSRLYQTSSIMFDEKSGEKLERPAELGKGSRENKFQKPGELPFGWKNLAAGGIVIALLLGAYYYIKAAKDAIREADRKREVGKSKIGGTFDLIDQHGNAKTSEDYYGKWVLLYFGFTHCPDICPDEMEKMADVYDKLKAVKKRSKFVGDVVPLMITVDPERDGVKQMAEYCKEFHPELVGLTGTVEQITKACKAFRVYFSAGPRDEEEDYIVDHTIIIYLLDPKGQFVDYYGQTKTADQIVSSITLHMGKETDISSLSKFFK